MPNLADRTDFDKMLMFSGLEPAEIEQMRDWYCFTKPIGPSIRIMATAASGGIAFSVVAAGNGTRGKTTPVKGSLALNYE